MTSDKDAGVRFWARFGLRRLALAVRRPPRLTICIAVYYGLLIAFGVVANTEDPLDGILAVLFFTHLFILVSLSAQGAVGVLIVVGVPVGMTLCAVGLKGWWRIAGVMGLLIATNAYSIHSAAQLGA